MRVVDERHTGGTCTDANVPSFSVSLSLPLSSLKDAKLLIVLYKTLLNPRKLMLTVFSAAYINTPHTLVKFSV